MKKTVRKLLSALLTAALMLALGVMANGYEWNKADSSLTFAQDTQVKTVVIATYEESGKMLSARVVPTDSGNVLLEEPEGYACEAFFLDENGAPALPSVPYQSLEDWDERYDDLSITESGAVSGGLYQNVTVTDAVGDGEVTLTGLTIHGDLIVSGGGSNSVKLIDCTLLGKVIMNKTSGAAPRLLLTNTPVSAIEVKTPAILEATDDASAVTEITARAALEIKGDTTLAETVTVPAGLTAPVAITVTGGAIDTVEAKGEVTVGGAAGSVGTVVAEADVTLDSAAVSKVEIPAAAPAVSLTVTGSDTLDVKVNSANGAAVSGGSADISFSTELAEVPEVKLNGETAHVHRYGTWNYLNEQEHQRICADDATHVEEDFHDWDEGSVTVPPTAATEGVMTYTCSTCLCTTTETIPTLAPQKVAAANGIVSAQQMGFTLRLGLELPEDTTNIDYFELSLYDSTAPTQSRMSGITCSISHPYFYVNKAKFDPDYNYDTVEIVSYALNGWEHAVWTDSICVTQGHYTREFTYTYDAANDPMPLLTLNLNIQSYAFYHIAIYDNGVEIANDEGYAWSDDAGSVISRGCSDAEKAAIEGGTATVKLDGWQIYQADKISGVWNIGFRAYSSSAQAVEGSGASELLSLLPTNIHLENTTYGGLTMLMTPPQDTSLIQDGTIKYTYNINNGAHSSARSLRATVGSTAFLTDYSVLNIGANTVEVTVTATPTEAAAAAGYGVETTTFTATVNYAEETVDYNIYAIKAIFGPSSESGKKCLTVMGLKPNQSYKVAVKVSSTGTVNHREFTTDAEGTGVSEWYTDYAFDCCTINEWEVSDVTDTSGSITSRAYAGEVLLGIVEEDGGDTEETTPSVSFTHDYNVMLNWANAEVPASYDGSSRMEMQVSADGGASWTDVDRLKADEVAASGSVYFLNCDLEPGTYTKFRAKWTGTDGSENIWFTADINAVIGSAALDVTPAVTYDEASDSYQISASGLPYNASMAITEELALMESADAGFIGSASWWSADDSSFDTALNASEVTAGSLYRIRVYYDLSTSGSSCSFTIYESEWFAFELSADTAEPVFGTPVLKTDGAFMWLELTVENVEDPSTLQLWVQQKIASTGVINSSYMTQSSISTQWELEGNVLKIYRVGYIMLSNSNLLIHVAVKDPASGVMSEYSTNALTYGTQTSEDVSVTAVKAYPAAEGDYYTITATRNDGADFAAGHYYVNRPSTMDYTSLVYMENAAQKLVAKNRDCEILGATSATVKHLQPRTDDNGNIAVDLVAYNTFAFDDVSLAEISSADGVGTVSAARGNPVTLTMTIPDGVTLTTDTPTVGCRMYNTVISDVAVSGNAITFTATFNNLYATQDTVFYLAADDTNLDYPLCTKPLAVNYIELVGISAQVNVEHLYVYFYENVTFYKKDGTVVTATDSATVHEQVAEKLILYKNGVDMGLSFIPGYQSGSTYYFFYGDNAAVNDPAAEYSFGFKDGMYFRSSANPNKGYIGNPEAQYNGPMLQSAGVNMTSGLLTLQINAYDRTGESVPEMNLNKSAFALAPAGYWNREQYQFGMTGSYAKVDGGTPTEKGTYTMEKTEWQNVTSGSYKYSKTIWNVTVKLTDADLAALQAKLDSYNGTDAFTFLQREGFTTASSSIEHAVNPSLGKALTVVNQLESSLSFKVINAAKGTHSGSIYSSGTMEVLAYALAETVDLTYNGVTITVPYPADGVLTVTADMFA